MMRSSATFAAVLLPLTIVCLVQITSAADRLDDFDLSNKAGSKVCVGKICDDSSAFHYYSCCGQLLNDCCFHLQTWVLIVLIVLVVMFVASFVVGLIRCICCCDRNN